jgi:CubicO group peptidase (beta-lactamase class C family)
MTHSLPGSGKATSHTTSLNKGCTSIRRKLSSLAVIIVLLGQLAPFSVRPTRAESSLSQPAGQYLSQIQSLQDFLKKRMVSDKVPAVSIGFVKDGFFWSNSYGFADLENKLPAQGESSYRLASVTKPMTAAAILLLAEKGKIDLDAEVQTYVPYFPKRKWSPTVRQLLGHIGGIDDYRSPGEQRIKESKTTRESIAIFENFDFFAEPGTAFFYTSYGYNLLGAVIEEASGQRWEEYVRENIWAPLGMRNTRADSPADLIPNRVRGYRLLNNQVKNSEFVDVSSRLAAGGIRTTVPDMLRFGKGILDRKILSAASYEMMFETMMTRDGRFTDYGMGWNVAPQNGQFVVTHNGAQQETSTALYVFPGKKLAIAVASNLEGAPVDFYAKTFFEILTGEGFGVALYDRTYGDKSPFGLAVWDVFESGRGYFYRHQKPFTQDESELKDSFAYFNQTLSAETLSKPEGEALKKVRAGRHSSANRSFIKMGSFVAQKLDQKYGSARLASYSNAGAIAFLHDYIMLYEKDSSISKELHFDKALEDTIAEWERSWRKTKAVRNFEIEAENDIKELTSRLRKTFANEAVYPNLSEEMTRAMQKLALDGQIERAVRIGELAEELYPRLENPSTFHGVYGVVLIVSGERTRGKKHLERAFERNANGVAAASRLNQLAKSFAESGMIDQAVLLLLVAVELHPKVAGLQYSLGELYIKKGMKSKAAESYSKALEINPNFPNAESARAALKKLGT